MANSIDVSATTDSFKSRQLVAIIHMPNNNFSDGTNTLTVANVPIRATINTFGSNSTASAVIEIYGLNKADMDAMTVYRWKENQISAGYFIQLQLPSGIPVFSGTVVHAFAQYDGAPNVPFIVEAYYGAQLLLNKAPPVTFPGDVPVDTIAKKLSDNMGAEYENIGVTRSLTDQYLWGSDLNKLWQLAAIAGIIVTYHGGIVRIYDKGQYKKTEDPPYISAETGLVGWPMKIGPVLCDIRSLFNTGFIPQGDIILNSEVIPGAKNKKLYISSMVHTLESNIPGGAWFTDMRALEI